MKTILLIDDNRYVIEAVALTLSRHIAYGDIIKVSNGREGVDILNRFSVDLILTDLQMPIMDGYSLIMYRNRHFPHVPVVAMTGDASPNVMQKLNALGVTECLEKPIDFDFATRLIMKILAPHHGISAPRAEALRAAAV
jgi:two-component system CAI-1 autoinducer sensor kinase/phosphatase CqsS